MAERVRTRPRTMPPHMRTWSILYVDETGAHCTRVVDAMTLDMAHRNTRQELYPVRIETIYAREIRT